MIIKQSPENFIVNEVNYFKLSAKGKHKIFSLKKTGRDLFEVLDDIARKNRIPAKRIAYAGIKDKVGVTTQYISVPNELKILIKEGEGYKLSFLGYCEDPVKRGGLQGNQFEIIVRDLTKDQLENAKRNAGFISKIGVPNYFDSQRFGSYIENKFIVKDILKGDLSSAIKLYLTHKHPEDVEELTMYKKILAKKWDKLEEFDARNSHGRDIIEEYQKTKDWTKAYKKIPALEREMFITAYQAYLWNEVVKIFVRQRIPKENLYSVNYKAGNLVFFNKLNMREGQYIPRFLQTISPDQKIPFYLEKIQNKVLEKEEVSADDFDVRELTGGNYFHSQLRPILITPKNLKIEELNKNSAKITFEFKKASYATIILKALFGE